jgi:hypothetical protein
MVSYHVAQHRHPTLKVGKQTTHDIYLKGTPHKAGAGGSPDKPSSSRS